MSTLFRHRLTLALLTTVLGGGALLTILLALGLADPPRAGSLQWQTQSPNSWLTSYLSDEMIALASPVSLPANYTLELIARNDGPTGSAWGIFLENTTGPSLILIDNQGYVSVSSGIQPDWEEFIHLQTDETNKLYLHVETGSKATLRLNDEIAWTGEVDSIIWRIVHYRQPQLAWEAIRLYHE